MTTADFYPDAHPETSSVDGYANRALVLESWSNIRSGAGVSSDDSSTTLVAAGVYNASTLANRWYTLRRILLVFDTSSIPAGATIVSATLTVRCVSKSNGNSWSDTAAGLALVGSTPASNTAIAASDYGQTGSTRLASDKNYSGFTAGSDATFTLNSSGLAAIGKGSGGRTKLALRFVADLDNTDPPHSFGATTAITLIAAENTNDPKLSVTYTTPATAEVTKVSLSVTAQTPGVEADASVEVTKKSLSVTAQSVGVTVEGWPEIWIPRRVTYDSKVSLNVWDKGRTRDFGNIDDEVKNVKMATLDPGGDGPLSFRMEGRDSSEFYDDIQQGNQIAATYEGEEVWGGLIFAPKGGSDGVSIQADGIISRLKRTRTNIHVPPGPGSQYIIDYSLTHEALSLASGEIDREDFTFPYGIDIGSTSTIAEIIEKINRANAYYWGLRGWKLDFYPHNEKAYYWVHAEDCESPEDIEFTFDDFVNYLWYTWTENSITRTDAVWDEASIKKWDRWDDEITLDGECSAEDARIRALVVLGERSKMRPKTNIVTSKVYIDNDSREIPLPLVRAGRPLSLVGKFSGAQSVLNSDRINELSTFRVVGTSLDCDAGLINMSPGQLGSRADVDAARREAMTLTDRGAA